MVIPGASIDALERLRQQAAELSARAEQITEHYNRTTWFRFVLVFFPIPFVVVLLRLEIEAWGYYVAGALLIVEWAGLYMLDGRESARADAAVEAAERARQAYETARDEVSLPR
jgi:hypothetical protein